jgi:glutaredoxin
LTSPARVVGCGTRGISYDEVVVLLRSFIVVVIAGAVSSLGAGTSSAASAPRPRVSSLASAPVTVFDAKWCSACRALERGLTERKVAFDTVDVDTNPAAFARAREAAGASNAIPLTSIVRTTNTVWVVGADVDAVERAQRGE